MTLISKLDIVYDLFIFENLIPLHFGFIKAT
jgi:hypothetical protein